MSPSKWLFFPTQSSASTTWRDEADHSWEAEITSAWASLGNVTGLIGLNSGTANYSITIDGDLTPANDTGGGVNSPNKCWSATTFYSSYQTVGVDFTQHPDSTSTTSGSQMSQWQAGYNSVIAANSNFDWVYELEDSSGNVFFRRRFGVNRTGTSGGGGSGASLTWLPDWSGNMGSHYWWSSTPKWNITDYAVGNVYRFYWFDDATTIQDSNWPPSNVV